MVRSLLLFFIPILLGGQQPLPLDHAVSAALDTHPLLAAARQRIEGARGQRRQAGLRPNTELILQTENVRAGSPQSPFVFWRQSESFGYLQQTFETAGKRGRRLDAAEQAIRRSQLEAEVLRRRVALGVKQAYWQAAGAQRILELLEENLRTFQQIVEYHEIRVKEGAMAEGDLLRVRLEADRIALAANQAQLDAQRARIELYRQMGQGAFPEVRFTDPLAPPEDRLLLADPDRAVQQRPEVALAQVEIDEARAGMALSQANARPNYEFYFGYKRAETFNTLIGGMQFEIPWLNRNQGNIETAAAQVRLAEANLAATEALVRAEVSAAEAGYRTRRRQVLEFLTRFREQAAETSSIAQAAYRLGGADLLRLLDAERLRIEIELLSWRTIADYRGSIVALENAMGVQP